MAIIASALEKIKSDPLSHLGGAHAVNAFFAQGGHCWRNRRLDPATTLSLFVRQVLESNTAIRHLPHLSGVNVSDSSYCEARQRLPAELIAGLVEVLSKACCPEVEAADLWLGRRVMIADGTCTITPDTPALQAQWPQSGAQKPGCGFPAVKLLGTMNLATGMIHHLSILNLKVHEFSQFAEVSKTFSAGDVLLGDCAFCSFVSLAVSVKHAVDAVFRGHQKTIYDFTPSRPHRTGNTKTDRTGMPTSRFVKSLGPGDQIVDYVKPASRPTWMSEEDYDALPATIRVRELQCHIETKGHRTRIVTIVTTLLDDKKYSKQEIIKLYRKRWEIEINFKHLKTTLKMEHLKCKNVDGVTKELLIYVLVYNMVRATMVIAARRQKIADANRISFIDTLRWLCALTMIQPGPEMPEFHVNKPRRRKGYPRVVKKRKKQYDLKMTPPKYPVKTVASEVVQP